ncbi:MAG: PQQ-binding-like beta-propeller repeat protein [Planctomycetes bacterium]|nr:PQQ-binding-like beta-propeller repeat protein [Planctomycetota bacterium]
MKSQRTTPPTLSILALLACFAAGCFAFQAGAASPEDWPRFRGPQNNGLSPETGLLDQWPEDGPELLWQIEGLGRGYSTVSIAQGKIFTMGDRPGDDGAAEQSVIALELATRRELWATTIGPPHRDGPRCTPTVDGDSLYVIGTSGVLACLDAATGEIRWQKSFADDFQGKMMSVWKFSESPLIDGDKLVCTPGGPDATIVALDKKTGETIWKCAIPDIGGRGKDGAGYSSMIVAEIDGVRQYVQILGRGAVGVEAESGKFLWGYNRIANGVANIPTPIVRGDHVFVTTSYKTGSALLKLTKSGDGMDVEEVYFLDNKQFENHHGGVVLVGDYLYGGDGQNKSTPVCLEWKTGKILWKAEPPGRRSAALLYADGHLYFRYEDGLVALVAATPDEFRLEGTFRTAVKKGPSWPHPVIHDGKLYLRDNDTLMCYNLRRP